MITRLAAIAVRRPRTVLLAALAVVVLCAGLGVSVVSMLQAGGYASPAAEAANDSVHRDFPGASPNFLVMVSSPDGADSADARAVGARVTAALHADADVVSVHSFTDATSRPRTTLIGRDGRDGLIVVDLAGDATAALNAAHRLDKQLSGQFGAVAVRAGGEAGVFSAIATRIAHDLIVAEVIAVPVTMVLLILVFGSVVAAALPVMIGLISIATTLGILRILTVFTDVSIFALNMTTALGFALAIDYSLFIVSRYREERAAGADTRAAVVRAVQTAGRTVVFSAVTVAVALGALTVFNAYFLRSFAYAGIAVVAAAAAAAVLVLPAALVFLGDRIDALDLRSGLYRVLGRTPRPRPAEQDSHWYRLACAVMKRPGAVAVATTALLLLLGAPFLGARLAYPDERVLPASAPSRQVAEILDAQFVPGMRSMVAVALPGYHGPTREYAAALSRVAAVDGVTGADGLYVNGDQVAPGDPAMATAAGSYVQVASRLDPMSAAGSAQVSALRDVPAPASPVFGGTAPVYADALHEMYARLPAALGIVAVTSLIVLFLFTGSVLLPVKAVILNLLSLTATFGAMVWVFQDGHLSGLLGFTPTGTLNANMPPLMFCLAFGMSMDFEVFLLSRIREQWLASDRTAAANTHAVAIGVARTGRIFTAAAALMAVVFLAIATSGVSSMKMFGIGLALAVIADATVIRLLLAPALMNLMGTANWWLPEPLVRLHRRFGIDESPSGATVPTATGVPAVGT
ncbi:MMPL family transporter [Mycolicibacterium sp.]|uniref:MMPL family transporter n=1 Tax=Mycolicibacterium sp. TaxID=2320850 RepID=UPI0028A613FF|nr:MMPL family transporter [Mycolicibacterium sp.]